MSAPTDEQLLESAQKHYDEQRAGEALAEITGLLNRRPDHPEALNLSGLCLSRLQRTAEAETAFRSAVQARPNYATALNNLGVMLAGARRNAEAAEVFARAADLRPRDAITLLNLANAYAAQERYDPAITAYRRCLTVNPNVNEAHCNMGHSLRALGKIEEALAYFHQAASLRGNDPDALDLFATALRDVGRYDEAEETYRRALKFKRDHASAHWNLSLLLLLRGRFEEGWKEYEWRLRMPDSMVLRLRKHHPALALPPWDGASPAGKRLYIYAEQGFGDTIHFARYLPLLAGEGARITFACHPALVPLMREIAGIEQCLPLEQRPPEFDGHYPLMSLPLHFKTALETIPAAVPYIQADAAKIARWRSRLAGDARRRIGLVWAGRRKPDPRRSMTLADLAPLLGVTNVHWISLQKGDAAAETRQPPAGLFVSDWTSELNDFSDTAALLANLDGVVTIDTAVAHLAGAMGKPVFLLLPRFATWRWLLDRADSPWYPTMRLFRQEKSGDWPSAVGEVVRAL